MTLLIKPLEPFFFRDARPFDKGEGWATGIFPPLPSTIYGAIRTAAISQKSTINDYYSGFFANYSMGKAVRKAKADVYFCGHSHSHADVMIDGIRCINNGSDYGRGTKRYDVVEI